MSKRLQHIIFFIILLSLSWVWIKASHGDEEDLEYNSGNRNETTGLFSILSSDVVRVWRNIRHPQCWRSNPDDPKGEILKGVDCPRRLRIIDKNNPIRKCIGVLILKYRAKDGDLIFDVVPNEEYKYLINQSNVSKKKGGLHCEIVPDDRTKFRVSSCSEFKDGEVERFNAKALHDTRTPGKGRN